jgi:lysophospholipase L1-like esterase
MAEVASQRSAVAQEINSMKPAVRSRPSRAADFVIAAAILALALALSPLGIRLTSGRLDLSPRVIAVALAFDTFLLVLAAAVLTRGRLRFMAFYLLILTFPVALLAALEAAAIGSHLADRIAPLEDMSTLVNKDRWPAQLMSAGRKVTKDGLQLYQAWDGDGVSINDLGLRTALPSPKAPGEWRIAMTGGSVAFGWRVRDADTIPVELQRLLRAQGRSNVSIYNFAIDSFVIADELAVLKRFCEVYGIDQVVFLTGVNDVTTSYIVAADRPDGAAGLFVGVNEFELLKVMGRLKVSMSDPSPSALARLGRLVAGLAQRNSLRDGMIAADEFCRATALTCDFVLQPVLSMRKTPIGPEIRLARTVKQVYPRYDQAFATMYRSVLHSGLPIHDSTDVFDGSAEPYFIDIVHLNEAGNRKLAERIAGIISGRMPSPALEARTKD